MALDARVRRQLVVARGNITTQLMQLEAATLDPYSLGGSPDYQNVYAELQKELREIDALLGTDAGGQGREPSDVTGFAYQPMEPFMAAKAQGMWRFRGVAVASAAFWVIGLVMRFTLSNDRTGLLSAGVCFAAICLASVWTAARKRGAELRLFLFTLAIGSALAGAAVLLAALTT